MRHRLADDIGPAHNGGIEACEVLPHAADQAQAAQRRARHEGRLAREQLARVHHVKAVHVLPGRDRVDSCPGVDLRRQRKLNKNAVNSAVSVERRDDIEQFRLAGARIEPMLDRVEPKLPRDLQFAAHIDLAGRTLANQNHGETWPSVSGQGKGGGALRHGLPDIGGQRHAVQENCFSHGCLPFDMGTEAKAPSPSPQGERGRRELSPRTIQASLSHPHPPADADTWSFKLAKASSRGEGQDEGG